MKIRGSRYRVPCWAEEKARQEALEEAERQRKRAESDAYIAAKKAHLDELQQTTRELRRQLCDWDWLCFLPAAAGSPDVIGRTCKYMEAMRGRVEAAGEKLWLNKNHGMECAADFLSHVFEIHEFRVLEGSVYCSGFFTDWRFRDAFRGVSPDYITFAGDIPLVCDIARKQPENCGNMDQLPPESRVANQSSAVLGLCGAAMIDVDPAYGRTEIRRVELKDNKEAHRKMVKTLAELKRELQADKDKLEELQ
jgi:hypothetical protein